MRTTQNKRWKMRKSAQSAVAQPPSNAHSQPPMCGGGGDASEIVNASVRAHRWAAGAWSWRARAVALGGGAALQVGGRNGDSEAVTRGGESRWRRVCGGDGSTATVRWRMRRLDSKD
eukprot:412580-Prymnesium_polylepis.1